MKNRKLRKILLTICSAMLLVCLSVGATVAYLTSTQTVTNTFTAGNVSIKLDEGEVDSTGKFIDVNNKRGNSNIYHLYPGHEYDKDPTIHIVSTDDAWLRLVVTVENADALDKLFAKYEDLKPDTILNGIGTGLKNFTQISSTKSEDVRTYIFDYNTTVNKTTGNNGDIELFNKVCIPADFTNEDMKALNGANMTIKAYAVQAAGFTTCDAAMKAGFPTEFGTDD